MDRPMVPVLSTISIAAAAIAVSFSAIAANAPWPKEVHDTAITNCVAQAIAGSPLTAKERQMAETMCQCMIDGYEKILTIEELQEAAKLSTEEQDKLPKADEMREIIDACGKKAGL